MVSSRMKQQFSSIIISAIENHDSTKSSGKLNMTTLDGSGTTY